MVDAIFGNIMEKKSKKTSGPKVKETIKGKNTLKVQVQYLLKYYMITIVGYVSAFKYFHTKQEEKKQFSEEIELALSQLVAGYARETAELQRRNEMRSQEGISIKFANENR